MNRTSCLPSSLSFQSRVGFQAGVHPPWVEVLGLELQEEPWQGQEQYGFSAT